MGKQQSIDANLPTKRNFDQHFFFIFFRCGMCPTLPTFQNEEGWEVPRYSVPFADSRVSQPNLPPKKHSGFTTIAMAKTPSKFATIFTMRFFWGIFDGSQVTQLPGLLGWTPKLSWLWCHGGRGGAIYLERGRYQGWMVSPEICHQRAARMQGEDYPEDESAKKSPRRDFFW